MKIYKPLPAYPKWSLLLDLEGHSYFLIWGSITLDGKMSNLDVKDKSTNYTEL